MGGRRGTGSGGTGAAAKACTASHALALGGPGSSRAFGGASQSLGGCGLLRSCCESGSEGAGDGAFEACTGGARAGDADGGGRQKALSGDVLASAQRAKKLGSLENSN